MIILCSCASLQPGPACSLQRTSLHSATSYVQRTLQLPTHSKVADTSMYLCKQPANPDKGRPPPTVVVLTSYRIDWAQQGHITPCSPRPQILDRIASSNIVDKQGYASSTFPVHFNSNLVLSRSSSSSVSVDHSTLYSHNGVTPSIANFSITH